MTKDEIILAQQARIEKLRNCVLNNCMHADNCDVLCLDDEGRHMPCSCGLSAAIDTKDDLSALRAHDAKLLAPYQWQPIETAPKDGTEVILWFPFKDIAINGHYGEVSEGDWETGNRTWMEWLVADELWFQEDPSQAPTHWMPLPSTEAIEKGGV